MEEGWINERWCLYEAELLIRLRERMDGRLLLGKVFHDRDRKFIFRKLILVLPDDDRCQDQEDFLKMSSNDHKESPYLTSRRLKQSR